MRTKQLWIAFLIANTLTILGYWLYGALGVSGGAGWMISLGGLAGLLAAFLILLQFATMGRNPWLERTFGFDKLAKFHSKVGKWGFIFLLLHPLLIIGGYAAQAGISPREQAQSLIEHYPYMTGAFIALALFILVVASSIHVSHKRLRYEWWYTIHLVTYIAVGLSIGHQFALGANINGSTLFYGYWAALYVVVFVNHLAFRFVNPLLRNARHGFAVSHVERETRDVLSIYITGKELDAFSVQPGQFLVVRFFQKGLWSQAHPFSLSKSPDGKELRITVKELGDFTKKLSGLAQGTRVFIEGPYGVFTKKTATADEIVFIAGGIGITPIRALLEQVSVEGKKLTLLYANKTEEDIVFKEELEQLVEKANVNVVNVFSEDESASGEHGYIDEEKIKRLAPHVSSADVFLCGPPAMMKALFPVLEQMGVPKQRIHSELFSL